jgi:hypothetical protein
MTDSSLMEDGGMKGGSRSAMQRLHGARRWLAVLLVVAVLVPGISCYGSFPLTYVVYEFNGGIPGPLKQVAFWVLLILPVYEVAVVGDMLVLNLIEFWTGADMGGFSRSGEVDGVEFAMQPSADGRTAAVVVTRHGEPVTRAQFVRLSDDLCEVRSPEGELLGSAVRTAEGALRLERADGEAVATLSADEFAALTASAR